MILNPGTNGDIPRVPKRSYKTSSVRVPRVSSSYTFRQIVDKTQIQQSSTAFGFSFGFTFGDLDGVSSLGSLFDQYRLDAIKLHIVPDQTALQVATLSTTQFNPLYCVIDYDDGNVPTSAGYCRQYNNCIELMPGESLERTIAPRVELSSVIGGTATNTAVIGPQWQDCSVTNLVHRGIKIWVPASVASQTVLQTWSVYAEYFVTMRNVR